MDVPHVPNIAHLSTSGGAIIRRELGVCLARIFDQMHSRQMVAGLFLSSGIFRDPDHTQERLLNVVEAIRGRYGFKGYVHLKVMPGTTQDAFYEAARRLGTRLSVNMEAPTAEHLARVSAMKRFDDGILRPMQRIDALLRDGRQGERDGREGEQGAVGQATQLVVGMGEETDLDIYQRMRSLYEELHFKRVYYSPFRPIQHTPLEERPPAPLSRAHRLYQLDWLSRVYRYSDQELRPVFDRGGFMDPRIDPKLAIAAGQLERDPLDVNVAPADQLLRVPGIGPLSAERIVRQRQAHSITRRQELQAMGVVLKRALPFLRFPGHRPPTAKQAKLDLFGEDRPAMAPARQARGATPANAHEAHAASGCAGCAFNPTSCRMAGPPAGQAPAPP